MVNNVLFLEIIEGYIFRVFQGLPLFGRLLLFVFDKVPRAMLIWGGYYYSAGKSTFSNNMQFYGKSIAGLRHLATKMVLKIYFIHSQTSLSL